MQLLRLNKSPPRRIEVEQLRVSTPVDRRLQLPQRLFFAELLVQHIVKELFRHTAVALGLDRAHDLPQQQHIFDRSVTKQLLLPQNLGVRVLRAGRRNLCVAFGHLQKAQQLCGIDDRQQVVDLESQIVRQPVDIVLAVVVQHQLQKTCNAARPRMRQHLVVHLALVANLLAGCRLRQRRRLRIGLRQHLVDVVDQLRERRRLAVARMRNRHSEIRAHMARIAPKHNDAIGQQYRLFDVVRHDEDRLCRNRLLLPKLQQFTAQVLRRQHVQGREGLVHKQHFGLDDQCPRESDALPHPAGELLRIGCLKSVQTDGVENLQAAFAPLGSIHAARLQWSFDVLKHRQPRKQRKALKHDRHIHIGRCNRLLMPVHLARRRCR